MKQRSDAGPGVTGNVGIHLRDGGWNPVFVECEQGISVAAVEQSLPAMEAGDLLGQEGGDVESKGFLAVYGK